MISKLQYAINYCALACLPRPTGVSSCVFVPHNLEDYRPIMTMHQACMAFMRLSHRDDYGNSVFKYQSTKKKGEQRTKLEAGDWMFYMSPITAKIKKSHLGYVEWIMGKESKALSKQDKPDSWAVVNDGENNSILVFVHDNLEFRAKSMFLVNTLLRAIWEYPSHVDKWVELVEAGIDKDEALYFMWVIQGGTAGKYNYGFQSGGHCPFVGRITFDNFLKGEPIAKFAGTFLDEGWETGINGMWGTAKSFDQILNITGDRYTYTNEKDLITLIKERNK